MFGKVNGAQLFFDIEGAGLRPEGEQMQAKPALLLLHGSLFDHSYFKPLLSPLSDSYQLIYTDLRGFGLSSHCEPENWTMDCLVEDICALIDYLGLTNVYLMGHSFGALLAALVANNAPQKLAGLFLLNPVCSDFSYFFHNVKTLGGERAELIARQFVNDKQQSALDQYLEHVAPLTFVTQPGTDMVARGKMSIPLTLKAYDFVEALSWDKLLSAMPIKTDVLCGSQDIYNPPGYFSELAQRTTNSLISVEEYAELGHVAIIDNPSLVCDRIRSIISVQDDA